MFPVGGTFSPDYGQLDCWSKIADRINHLILPVLVLGVAGWPSLMRLMRSQILEIKNSEFVRTARAKGLPERMVMYKHVLRNALNPVRHDGGLWAGRLARRRGAGRSGDESSGTGLVAARRRALARRPLVMGSVLMGTVLLLMGNLLADIALVAVDPRVDFSSVASQ